MFLANFGYEANVVEGGTTSATSFYDQRNQSVQVPDGLTVVSLSANLQSRLEQPQIVYVKLC